MSLDRETQDVYELVAVATDGGSLALSSSATVTVTVEDDNDHTPDFRADTLTAYIKYQTVQGTYPRYKLFTKERTSCHNLILTWYFESDFTLRFLYAHAGRNSTVI